MEPLITVEGVTYTAEQVKVRLAWVQEIAKRVFEDGVTSIYFRNMERDITDVRAMELQDPMRKDPI